MGAARSASSPAVCVRVHAHVSPAPRPGPGTAPGTVSPTAQLRGLVGRGRAGTRALRRSPRVAALPPRPRRLHPPAEQVSLGTSSEPPPPPRSQPAPSAVTRPEVSSPTARGDAALGLRGGAHRAPRWGSLVTQWGRGCGDAGARSSSVNRSASQAPLPRSRMQEGVRNRDGGRVGTSGCGCPVSSGPEVGGMIGGGGKGTFE